MKTKLTPGTICVVAVILFVGLLIFWIYWPSISASRVSKYDTVQSNESTQKPDDTLTKMGQYGDSYGSLNALLTGLAFIAVAATFLLQWYTIRTQKHEFAQQQFVNRFYELLNAWQNERREIIYKRSKRNAATSQGVSAFCDMENDFLGEIGDDVDGHLNPEPDALGKFLGKIRLEYGVSNSHEESSNGSIIDPIALLRIRENFNEFYESKIGAPMGHIFRMQYELVRYVDSEKSKKSLSQEVCERLIRTYQALLSDPELHLLLYYALSDFAANDSANNAGEIIDKSFKKLIDEYLLLKGLVDKAPKYVRHRIPEIQYYEKTIAEWNRRHPECRGEYRDPDIPGSSQIESVNR